MSVLVIDDNAKIRKIICNILNDEGYETFEAANGIECMQVIHSEPEINLVIIDLIMPKKEGIETIREIKKDFSHIKIIAISGGGNICAEDYLTIAEKLGADLTLCKPFTAQELKFTLLKLFDNKK